MEGNLQDLIEALHDNTTAQTEASDGLLTGIKELGRNLAAYGREQILFSRKPFEILNNTGLTFTEGIKTFTEAMDSGLNKLTKAQVDQIALLKRLNVRSSLWLDQMAFNTQVLKLSEKGANKLLDETMALSQEMHRNSQNLLKLQKSFSEVSKVMQVQKTGGSEGFLRNVRIAGAALGDQFYTGIQKLLGTFAGTTLQSFKTSQVLGGGVLSPDAGIREIVAMSKNMVNMLDPLVQGREGFPMYDVMSKALGFDADQLIAAREIVAQQDELVMLFDAELRATKPQMDFYATINESMRQIVQVFLPYVAMAAQKLASLLTTYQPKIVSGIQKFGDILYKYLSPDRISGWIRSIVDYLKPIHNWLMENLTWDNFLAVAQSMQGSFERGWQNIRAFWNDHMIPIFTGIWDEIKSIGKVINLIRDIISFLYNINPTVMAYRGAKEIITNIRNSKGSEGILSSDRFGPEINLEETIKNMRQQSEIGAIDIFRDIADNTKSSFMVLKKNAGQKQTEYRGGIVWPPREIKPSLYSNN
jgi:hypothetical protein